MVNLLLSAQCISKRACPCSYQVKTIHKELLCLNYEAIKKVHVVFKTHLDIGFTDLAQNVLDRYVNEHIPHAVELAFQMNTPDDEIYLDGWLFSVGLLR
ncbi:MAG: hypothetical protein ACLRVT_08010 [Oscillospiraceae bacterium]